MSKIVVVDDSNAELQLIEGYLRGAGPVRPAGCSQGLQDHGGTAAIVPAVVCQN